MISYCSKITNRESLTHDQTLLEEKIIRRLDRKIVAIQQEHTSLAIAPATGKYEAKGSVNMLPHIHLVNLGGKLFMEQLLWLC